MKKALFICAFIVCAAGANAQLQKGTVMIGANVANLNLGLGDNGDAAFSLTPSSAYFIQDRLAIGAFVNFGVTHTGGTEGSTLSYGVGPFGRYYISDPSIEVLKKGRFFAEGLLGFQGSNQTWGGGASTNGLGFGFGPGFAYFLNSNISLEAVMRYDGVVGFGSEPYTNHLTFQLGFQIYLPCKGLEKMVK